MTKTRQKQPSSASTPENPFVTTGPIDPPPVLIMHEFPPGPDVLLPMPTPEQDEAEEPEAPAVPEDLDETEVPEVPAAILQAPGGSGGRPRTMTVAKVKEMYAIDGMTGGMIARQLRLEEAYVDRIIAEEIGSKVPWPLQAYRDADGRVRRGSGRRSAGALVGM